MFDLIVPRQKHGKIISWPSKGKPVLREKYRNWCDDRILRAGKHWQIVLIRHDPGPPDYAIRFPDKAHAVLFHLVFKLYLVDSKPSYARPAEG